MFVWENPWIFWFLVVLLILSIIYFILFYRNKKIIENFIEIDLLHRLLIDFSASKPLVRFLILIVALTFLVISLANPLIGTKLIEGKRHGVDIIIALDVSNSMLAEDVKPNRLERAKQMIIRLLDKLTNDRIGIIVFAGESFVQLPLTTDYSAAKLFTSYIEPDMIPLQGTAIGSAIELAVEKFNLDKQRKKALIIITDGENHEDDPFAAAEFSSRNNFVIHTIGMGTLNGGPIPLVSKGKRDFLKDINGSVVTSKLDPVLLEKIALIGGGEFILNSGVDPDLSQIVEKIAKMEKKEYETKIFSNFASQFQYPLAVALILLLIEVFITERKNKLILALNEFVQQSSFKK